MNKQENLRKALLGCELYDKCTSKYGISEEELESRFDDIINEPQFKERLEQLDIDYNYLTKCTKDEFVRLCGLKDYEASDCLDNSDKNKIFYDKFKQNYYYDIIELDCSNKNDAKLLKKFQILEEQQKDEFTQYLSLGEGCSEGTEETNIFYVAFNIEKDEIGAVCKTTEFDSYVEINLLTTRAGKTKSDLYKGLGNSVLNYIVGKYRYTDFVGIILTSDPKAKGFYEKYGFEKMPQEDLYFYKLSKFKNIDKLDYSTHTRFLQNALDFALLFDDEDLVLKLKDKGVVPLENKRIRYLSSLLGVKYFTKELDITQEDFEKIVKRKKMFIIPYYIDAGFTLTEDEISDMITNNMGQRTSDILKSLVKQNYLFSNDLIQIMGEFSYEKNAADAFKIAVDLGFKIRPWLERDVKKKKENLDKIYNLALDNYKPDEWKRFY
jgi:hypothetical protein